MGVETKSKKPKKFKKSKKTISFEEEIVTRDEAQNLLKSSEKLADSIHNSSEEADHGTFNTVIHQMQKIDDPKENTVAKIAKKNKKRGQRKPQQIHTKNNDDVRQTGTVDESEPQDKIKKHKKDRNTNCELNEPLLPKDTAEEKHQASTVDESGPQMKIKKRKKNKDISTNRELNESLLPKDTVEEHKTSTVGEREPEIKTKKRKKDESINRELNETLLPKDTTEEHEPITPKKRKKRDTEPVPVEAESGSPNTEEPGAKKESIRQRKKKKHIKLVEEKKMKVEVQLQQKALEYLSRWKHSRNSWKFEKLRQIWLQQSLFESTKVPSEFWETTLEYFTSARGKVKSVLIQNALKIIEQSKPIEDNEDLGEHEEQSDNEELVKAKRARDIMQYLQEE